MAGFAELEIGLYRRDEGAYAVEMRFSAPDSDAEIRLLDGAPAQAQINLQTLRGLQIDPVAYGKELGAGLFSDKNARAGFDKALSSSQAQDVPLRLRLFVGPSATELHGLLWETLRDPQDGALLLTNERILFSRYLSSQDWRPVKVRPKAALRALVVVANGSDLNSYQVGGRPLPPVDVPGEAERATTGLAGIPVTTLASGGSATLDGMVAGLRDGVDVLYIVAHGALIAGEPQIVLEDSSGKALMIAGFELVTRLRELDQRPRLIVLASCMSAGSGGAKSSQDGGVLAALGPQLAEAGIPAVLAMQGNVTMDTVAGFMPVFFKELLRDGQIDRAAAVARGAVRERADFWAPVLFMRLRTGRIWYVPGFADDAGFSKWPALIRAIRESRCTPILGPGLTEKMLGSTRDIARSWADAYHFPMAPYAREDLPQVAQYVAVDQDEDFMRSELRKYLRDEMLRQYGASLTPAVATGELEAIIDAVGVQFRAQQPNEPHAVLAGLPFPIYVTTNVDSLLTRALEAAAKKPEVEICRWNQDLEAVKSVYDNEPDYRPNTQRPLVYHLFGRLEDAGPVVLTEDNYFDFLIGATSNKDLIPGIVRQVLANTSLLFLGFAMDEWNFRVLFRSLMNQQGGGRRKRYTHVAVQIDPEEGRLIAPERARRYLESYFEEVDMSIYWGSAEDFIADLWQRWQADGAASPQP